MPTLVAGQWYQVRIVAKGTSIKIFVDDMVTPKITYTDASFASGSIGVRSYNAIARWDNITVTNSTTPVKTPKVADNFQITPNPTSGTFEIVAPSADVRDVRIFDLNGKVLKRFKDKTSVYEVSNLNKGVYVLQANIAQKKVVTKLVVN
jgi:hypothetical protein